VFEVLEVLSMFSVLCGWTEVIVLTKSVHSVLLISNELPVTMVKYHIWHLSG
jgi:putative heme iron utilization protein